MAIEPATTLLIVGAGGHGRVVADAAQAQGAWARVVATDRDPQRWGGELLPGVPVLSLAEAHRTGAAAAHVAIGGGDARERETAAVQLPRASVLHPRACVSPHAQVGPGVFVAAQAVVAAGARLAEGVIVNHAAVVDHDCEVGAFSHVAPLAALGGGVRIGRHVLVGAGAQLLPGVAVCDRVVIGAGAVVRESIGLPGVYAGVPARRIR